MRNLRDALLQFFALSMATKDEFAEKVMNLCSSDSPEEDREAAKLLAYYLPGDQIVIAPGDLEIFHHEVQGDNGYIVDDAFFHTLVFFLCQSAGFEVEAMGWSDEISSYYLGQKDKVALAVAVMLWPTKEILFRITSDDTIERIENLHETYQSSGSPATAAASTP